ncbi:MAG: tetratricopeptide repeat protein [Muribaculaceae bacterium]
MHRLFTAIFFLFLLTAGASAQEHYSEAIAALKSGNYQQCYDLYHKHVLKELKSKGMDQSILGRDSYIPYFEACMALGKYDEAVKALTINEHLMSRKTWILDEWWKLDKNDLMMWPADRTPLTKKLLDKVVLFYGHDANLLPKSPLIRNISFRTGRSVDDLCLQAGRSLYDASMESYKYGANEWGYAYLLNAADLGNPEALKLASQVLNGGWFSVNGGRDTVHVHQDYDRAFRYYKALADQDDPYSATKCGEYYFYGKIGGKKDPAAALPWYRKAAEDEKAPYVLRDLSYKGMADCYRETGDSLAQFNTLRQAYEKGFYYSCNELGQFYMSDSFGSKSPEKAFEVYSKGMESKTNEYISLACRMHLAQMLLLGEGCPKNEDKGIAELKELSKIDFALSDIADILLTESLYSRSEYADAMKYGLKVYESEAKIPDVAKGMVCDRIARMYNNGRGVPVDKEAARMWWERAEKFGNTNAQDAMLWIRSLKF